MIGASLSKSVTKHIHTSTIFVDALRAAPRSIHGLERDTRGARKRVRAPRLIYSALPIVPGRRVRGEGAAPTVRWRCPRTRSMARLQRLQLSAAVSSVKNGAAIWLDRPQPVPHRRPRAPGRLLRETRDVTPPTRRARSSLASEPHTKRNAPRRHTHRVTPPPVTQAAATPSSPSTRTGAGPSTSGSCGRSSRPWARSRPRRSCFR